MPPSAWVTPVTVCAAPEPALCTTPPAAGLASPTAPPSVFVVCCTVEPSPLPVPETTVPSVFVTRPTVCWTR